MLLMVEKGITGGICHSIYRYAKANNKYLKVMIKIKNHHIFKIYRWIIYMVGQCHESFHKIILSGSNILSGLWADQPV